MSDNVNGTTTEQQVRQWLGKNNSIGADIFIKKYLIHGESFEEWLNRVSGGNPEIRKLIYEKKFLFGGRVLANRGIPTSGSLSNCYSHGFIEDDYGYILDAVKNLGMTYKAQGGQGVSLSKLRPKGAPIGEYYTSDGIVPFMKLYNQVTDSTSQGGSRKGALMISLDARHKEAETFITIKSESGIIEKANISLEVDDVFMEAVEKFYQFGEVVVLHEKREYSGHVVEYDVVPIKVFEALVNNSWDWGDPACLFTDEFRTYNMMEFISEYKIEGANPCLTGDMKILTDNGYETISDLVGKDVKIVSANGETSGGKVWHTGNKPTVKLTMKDNSVITCTPDHRFMTSELKECKAEDLSGKKILPFSDYKHAFDKEFIKMGFIQGDGNLTRLNSPSHKGIEVNVGIKDGDIRELFSDCKAGENSDRTIYINGYNDILRSLGFSVETLPSRLFPSTYDNWTLTEKASFLHGCYSANGCVVSKYRIQYKTTCREFADKLVDTLINDFGVFSYITTNKPTKVSFANGDYVCRESYDICIQRYCDIQRFAEKIGFYQYYKRLRLSSLIIERNPIVRSVEIDGVKPVYDFNEPILHWGVVNGYVTHNCGEQPLAKHAACCLGSLNLAEFVLNPFTPEASLNGSEFIKAVRIAIRGLDDIVEENLGRHPIPEQEAMAARFRNIGLGIMGYANALMMLGLKYGEEDAIAFTDEILRLMFRAAVLTSNELAKERGAFPGYQSSMLDSRIIKKHFSDEEIHLYSDLDKYGLRNCSLLSIAPTGSLSTILGRSGGVEPEYAIKYTRRTVGATDGQDTYYDVFCMTAQDYLDATGNKELPDCFITSPEIDYVKRIKTQAVMQTHVDTAISSTINLPKSATKDDVGSIYRLAWKLKCKGITVFRDGCKKTGILTTEKTKEKDRSLWDIIKGKKEVAPSDKPIEPTQCPECGEKTFVYEAGCGTCKNCGYGVCG